MPEKRKTVFVAREDQLTNPQYYARLWLAARNVPIARREWLDAIADALRDFDGEILYAPGVPYKIPCVDEVFGDDPDMRWMKDFLAASEPEMKPLRFSRKIERLRMIDLYFRVRSSEISTHFKR